ncbi:uncharacterized protein LOC124457430 [Xenia sp. Carnegie-2017]|uniref:uncharacterized protein LOC124457430 n=1 Tax=Xenia sp. Carnegie-2017 TaxID=2897299 RepID=UPI001F043921|nr:uncharacterized protein LOC124457430 [Xenia sp. Carnegie-2017]
MIECIVIQVCVALLCVLILQKILKWLLGINFKSRQSTMQNKLPNSNTRPLGISEDFLYTLGTEKEGSGKISLTLLLTSYESLAHQHVHDSVLLLMKRQPMLRAIIAKDENCRNYFDIKEIGEVMEMMDISTSEVKASKWKDVWFEYTKKQARNGLLWRLVILQEEHSLHSGEYVNTFMFNFNHACIDGVSSVKLCNQFLNNLNKLVNDSSYVEKDIDSLQLSPYFHDMINKTRKVTLYVNVLWVVAFDQY